MNNQQFRRLLLDQSSSKAHPNTSASDAGSTSRRDGSTSTAALGSRMRSSIPMTPRSVLGGSSGIDFARQLAERNAQDQPVKKKKFKSSAAPKGAKLPSGYRDRTQDRTSAEDHDDKASRIQALEEMVRLSQMDRSTFEKLRDEIVGGDIGTTHLVKGLDYKLLERVRKGEDVLNAGSRKAMQEESGKEQVREDDVEAELERLEAKEIAPLLKKKSVKIGEMAPPPPPLSTSIAGKKRSRDEILAELKASRKAVARNPTPESTLGPKFRKVGDKRESSRIERDDKGREVLITVDEEGRVKRKVKKAKHGEDALKGGNLPMPDKDAKPLGMEVPEALRGKQPIDEEDDEDIFEGAGSDYDPLGDVGEEEDDDDDDDDDDVSSDDEERRNSRVDRVEKKEEGKSTSNDAREPGVDAAPDPSPATAPTRNYFSTASTEEQSAAETHTTSNSLTNDPAILAALRKASKINPSSLIKDNTNDDEEQARTARRQKMLSASDRDAEDLDLGFGNSRFEDEEDLEDRKVKLSVWGGGKETAGGGGGGGEKKRKRVPKKKKGGDVNNAADVLKVLERRKAGKGG